ncbi:MAG TPA: hypothetical protein VHL98_16630 [Microvirga sp.]|jgi:hypothetical protein|nr:hypothetical protein [Microvirga sp.]
MRVVSCRFLGAAALLSLAAPAAAQGTPPQNGWVDPPTTIAPAQPTAPAPQPRTLDAPPARAAEPAPPARTDPPVRSAEPERAPSRAEPAVRTAEPERAAPSRAETSVRTVEPERAAPRPRPQAPAARPEPAPQRSARPAEESRPAPRPSERREAAQPRFPRREQSAQARAAKELAIDYLDFWSDPNAVALEAHEEFYAPVIRYHGREVSGRALQEEKRRFARRWPEREYRPRLDTMRTSCAGAFCTIRSTFDYRASDPNRGRTSAGTGVIELGVSFAGGQPVIVSETSSVLRRGAGDRTVSLEDAED